MNQKKFIEDHIETMMRDKTIKNYLDNAKSEVEKDLLRKGLEQSMETAFNSHASEYFDSKGVASKFSKYFLRPAAAVADGIGSYGVWFSGGSLFGFKWLGLGLKGAAELIDSVHFKKHEKASGLEKVVSTDDLKIAAEAGVNAALSYYPYLPFISEAWAWYRGTKKYDNKIVGRALEQAKGEFVKKFGDYKPVELKIVPKEEFANPQYAEPVRQAA